MALTPVTWTSQGHSAPVDTHSAPVVGAQEDKGQRWEAWSCRGAKWKGQWKGCFHGVGGLRGVQKTSLACLQRW